MLSLAPHAPGLNKGHLFSPKEILALEIDDFGLRLAIVKRVGDTVKVSALTETKFSEFDGEKKRTHFQTLFTKSLAHLKKIQSDLPKQAILLNQHIVPAIVNLPIASKKPLPARDMAHLIHWELEPFFLENSLAMPVGAILYERKYLSKEQIEEVMAASRNEHVQSVALKMRSAPNQAQPRKSVMPKMFGQKAISMGFITEEQLNECLLIQQQAQVFNDDNLYGWASQKDSGSMGEVLSSWLSCGISREMRSFYSKTLDAHGISLKAFYPVVGSYLGILPQEELKGVGQKVIIESQPGFFISLFVNDGAISQIEIQAIVGRPLSVEDCLRIVGSTGTERIWLVGKDPSLPELAKELSPRVNCPVDLITAKVDKKIDGKIKRSPVYLSSLAGASRHALCPIQHNCVVRISADDPKPPWRERTSVWIFCTLVLCLIYVGMKEFFYFEEFQQLTTQEASLDKDIGQARKLFANLQHSKTKQANDETQLKKMELEKVKLLKDIKVLDDRLAILEGYMPERKKMTYQILSALSQAARALHTNRSFVSVNHVKQLNANQVVVNAWALTNKAAHQFVKQIAEQIEIEEIIPKIREQPGRLQLPGYEVDVLLTFDLDTHLDLGSQERQQ